MLKENKREEITKNIEKREALVEQVADGIWRIGVELPQNPLRELNSYLITVSYTHLTLPTIA